jgi:RimJ/RimL family protein N-acetyltransferase
VARLPDVVIAPPYELRRWRAEDVDALMEALEASRAELQRWMVWATPWPTREIEEMVLRAGAAKFDAGESFDFAIFDGDALIGGAGLMPVEDEPGVWQIGYWVRSDRTRAGVATAAARALTDAAFAILGLDYIQLRMDQANIASASVPPKLGYTLEREITRDVIAPGHSGKGFVWSARRVRS